MWLKTLVTVVVMFFIAGCGSSSSSSSGDSGSTQEKVSFDDTIIWQATGRYSTCDNYATGTYTLKAEDGHYTTLIYSGEEWSHDCSINYIGTQNIDISSLGLTGPLSEEDIGKLFKYLYFYISGYNGWVVNVEKKNTNSYEIHVYDPRDGSIEVIVISGQEEELTSGTTTADMNENTSYISDPIAMYVGIYSGVYSGADSGTWRFSIDEDGNIKGNAYSKAYGTISLSGKVLDQNDGSMVMGSASYGVTFSGKIDPNSGIVSGYWENNQGYSGTYRGKRE